VYSNILIMVCVYLDVVRYVNLNWLLIVVDFDAVIGGNGFSQYDKIIYEYCMHKVVYYICVLRINKACF